MTFWQWMGLAVAAAALCMVVRTWQPQMASLCAMAAGMMLLLAALESLSNVQAVFARLSALGGLGESSLGTLMKVLGVSYVAELAAQTCRDLGEEGLSRKVELVGQLSVFTLTAPLLFAMLEIILELVP